MLNSGVIRREFLHTTALLCATNEILFFVLGLHPPSGFLTFATSTERDEFEYFLDNKERLNKCFQQASLSTHISWSGIGEIGYLDF